MNLISKNDKIFIAGASGMVGSSLLRILKKNNYHNILKPIRKELDLLNFESVNSWFKKNKPDVVIIAAAKVGGIFANSNFPADFLLENLKIQTNIIDLSFKNNVKRLLFLGSSCIYPKFAPQPIIEESLLKSELEPTNEGYAIAKITGIKLIDSLNKQYGFDCFSLMPTNLYGFGDNYNLENSHVVPAMIRRFEQAKRLSSPSVTCWGTGKPLRELLNVDDLAKACLFALEKWDPKSPESPKTSDNKLLTYLNLGSNDEISIKNLANLVSDLVGFQGQIEWDHSKPDGTPRKKLNTERFCSLGWYPTIKLEEGLHQTIKDFRKLLDSDSFKR